MNAVIFRQQQEVIAIMSDKGQSSFGRESKLLGIGLPEHSSVACRYGDKAMSLDQLSHQYADIFIKVKVDEEAHLFSLAAIQEFVRNPIFFDVGVNLVGMIRKVT